MTLSESTNNKSSHKARRVILVLAFVVFCALPTAPEVLGQRTPRATDPTPPTTPPPRRIIKTKPRDTTTASATPSSVESYKFVDLGDSFREKGKWNAAEAAYNEATNVWRANGEALLKLGYVYLDEKNPDIAKKIASARAVQVKLRSVDSSLAATLLADINAFQNQVAH